MGGIWPWWCRFRVLVWFFCGVNARRRGTAFGRHRHSLHQPLLLQGSANSSRSDLRRSSSQPAKMGRLFDDFVDWWDWLCVHIWLLTSSYGILFAMLSFAEEVGEPPPAPTLPI